MRHGHAVALAKAGASGYRNVNGARARERTRTQGLSGLEQAIRNALERAERSDPDIRARIYQSARNALDLGLRKQEIADPDVIGRQRQRLEATIREIEDEELTRLRSIARFERVAIEREPEEVAPPVVEPPVRQWTDPGSVSRETPVAAVASAPIVSQPSGPGGADLAEAPSVEPERRLDARDAGLDPRRADPEPSDPAPAVERVVAETSLPVAGMRAEPRLDDGSFDDFAATRDGRSLAVATPPDGDLEAEDAAPPRRRRGGMGSFLVSSFVYLFLLGIVGGGVWWVYDTGMIDAALKGGGDFQLVPEVLRAKSDRPAREEVRLDTLRGFSGEWINIYKPGASAGAVTPRAGAKIDENRDSDGLATVIASNAPDQDGDVLIEVPASLLQDLAGKTSTIAVTVKSNTDAPAQIYVQCEFGTLGDCGRHRYTVTNERADELIQVKFDGKLGPSAPGHIVINSDLKGEGSSIRLYGIRVLPGS
jgi:hypothetical protein